MHPGPSSSSPFFGCRLVYWNCRGALSKKPDVEKLAESHDIIFLAETCLTETHDYRIQGFNCVRVDCSHPGLKGMTVFVRNSVIFSTIDLSDRLDPSVEAIAFRLSSRDQDFVIIGAYRHPNAPFSSSSFSNLFALAVSYQFSFIILMLIILCGVLVALIPACLLSIWLIAIMRSSSIWIFLLFFPLLINLSFFLT